MQRNFYTDDFEQLIHQKADQYKMYPSDHVWKGVHKALHGRRRWYWPGMAVVLLGLGVFTTDYLLNEQPGKQFAQKIQPSLTVLQQAADRINAASTREKNDLPSNPVPERIIKDINLHGSSLPIENNLIIFDLRPTETATPFISKSLVDEKIVGDQSTPLHPEKTENVLKSFADVASESSQRKELQVNWLQEFAV